MAFQKISLIQNDFSGDTLIRRCILQGLDLTFKNSIKFLMLMSFLE